MPNCILNFFKEFLAGRQLPDDDIDNAIESGQLFDYTKGVLLPLLFILIVLNIFSIIYCKSLILFILFIFFFKF